MNRNVFEVEAVVINFMFTYTDRPTTEWIERQHICMAAVKPNGENSYLLMMSYTAIW